MNKIKRLSRFITVVLYFSLGSILLSLAIAIFNTNGQLHFGEPKQMNVWLGLSIEGSWQTLAEQLTQAGFNAVLLLGVWQIIPLIIINCMLIKLFKLYQRGLIFAEANIRCFQYIGWALIGQFIIVLFYPPILTTIINTLHTDAGLPRSIGINDSDITMLLTGFIISVIAEVMRQGAEIQSEQELTI